MSMSPLEQRAAGRTDHPMAAAAAASENARETCLHYRGIKTREGNRQFFHERNHTGGNWCAMDCRPLLRQRAARVGTGWNGLLTP